MRRRLRGARGKHALYFDGTDDYVEVQSGFLPTSAITVEVLLMGTAILDKWTKWLNTGPSSTKGIVGFGFDYGGDRVKLTMSWNYGDIYFGTPLITNVINKWVYLAITWNGSYAYAYYNGDIINEGNVIGSPDWADQKLILGANHIGSENFQGFIGFVRVYNRALTLNEIKWNYYNPDNPITNGLVLWLHWDSIDDVNGKWLDKSGNGNDGVIYGARKVWI